MVRNLLQAGSRVPLVEGSADVLTLERAARRLSLSPTSVRRLIERKVLPASQVVAGAPWQIERSTCA